MPPKHIRLLHRWQPGVEFSVEDMGEGVLLRPVKPFAPTRLEDVLELALAHNFHDGGRARRFLTLLSRHRWPA